MKSILILGGSGFIGNCLYKELAPFYKTFATFHTKTIYAKNQHFFSFDVERDSVEPILKEVKPKLIISALRGNFNAQVEAHEQIVDYIKDKNCRILFLSSANVFDSFRHFPSYEYDKTLSESKYGHFKIKIEKAVAIGLIDYLHPSGWFITHISEVAKDLNIDEILISNALLKLQNLEPAGIF